MSNYRAPILDRDELTQAARAYHKAGKTVVLANGCFDLFHVGHLRYLAGARDLGDILIVGVNSDVQAHRLKGEGRPVMPEHERAELVSGLRCVDLVTIFPEPTVTELILAVRPDFHAKGTDYTAETVPEREVIARVGGRVAIVGDPKDHSSTSLISAAASVAKADN